jgi:hypothetical protein
VAPIELILGRAERWVAPIEDAKNEGRKIDSERMVLPFFDPHFSTNSFSGKSQTVGGTD